MRPELTAVTRPQGNNAAVRSGEIEPDGITLKFVDVPVLVHAFRSMVRELKYDVCEMALTTYLCAREHGVRFTALPIFLVRGFHHGAVLRHRGSQIEEPRQLEGRRVGVNRGYTVTTGVWARSVLQDEYGVDLSKVTWVLSGDEHVQAYRPPANVVRINDGESIENLLQDGELAAAINIKSDHPDIAPLIENPLEAGMAAWRARGHYPINHLIVVRDAVLDASPEVGPALFAAFAESKRRYLSRLGNDEIDQPDENDRLHAGLMAVGADPLPYGLQPNRHVLEELIDHALIQKILTRRIDIESVFHPSTHDLVG